MVKNANFDLKKFDGTNNFGMWQCEVLDILSQQELDVALEEKKSDDIDEEKWTRINRLACSTIRLSLQGVEVPIHDREISAYKLWKESEDKFMKMSMENKLSTR